MIITTFLYTALTTKSLKRNLYGLRAVFLNDKNKHTYTRPPSKIPLIVSFCGIRFFREHYEVGTKSGK